MGFPAPSTSVRRAQDYTDRLAESKCHQSILSPTSRRLSILDYWGSSDFQQNRQEAAGQWGGYEIRGDSWSPILDVRFASPTFGQLQPKAFGRVRPEEVLKSRGNNLSRLSFAGPNFCLSANPFAYCRTLNICCMHRSGHPNGARVHHNYHSRPAAPPASNETLARHGRGPTLSRP